MSLCIRRPTKCLGENKGTDQLHGNREADQRLCFRYIDSKIPLLLRTQISSLQTDFCKAWSVTQIVGFLMQRLISQSTIFQSCQNSHYFRSIIQLLRELMCLTQGHNAVLVRYITKTCPCYVYPLIPNFYIATLWGMQGYTYFSYFCSKT